MKGKSLVHAVCVIVCVAGCGSKESAKSNPAPIEATSNHFKVGQVWRYKTRDHEADSLVTIGRVESIQNVGTVAHIKITGLKMKSPASAGGIAEKLSHSPIVESKLVESLTTIVEQKPDLSGFDEGYNLWREAHMAGKAGVFAVTVKDLIDGIESGLNNRTK